MSIINPKSSAVVALFSTMAFFALPGTGNAGLITTVIEGENDCAGFFGDSFPECNIFGESPVIAKFEEDDIEAGDGSGAEVNVGEFPSVDGFEWSFGGGLTAGTWTYSPDDEGEDPGVRFYSVMSANNFSLNYLVAESDEEFCSDNPFNVTCIEAALTFETNTAIDWVTPTGQDVSHITFYDTGGGDITRMPVPGTLTLLVLGGLSLAARRRKTH